MAKCHTQRGARGCHVVGAIAHRAAAPGQGGAAEKREVRPLGEIAVDSLHEHARHAILSTEYGLVRAPQRSGDEHPAIYASSAHDAVTLGSHEKQGNDDASSVASTARASRGDDARRARAAEDASPVRTARTRRNSKAERDELGLPAAATTHAQFEQELKAACRRGDSAVPVAVPARAPESPPSPIDLLRDARAVTLGERIVQKRHDRRTDSTYARFERAKADAQAAGGAHHVLYRARETEEDIGSRFSQSTLARFQRLRGAKESEAPYIDAEHTADERRQMLRDEAKAEERHAMLQNEVRSARGSCPNLPRAREC